MPRVTDPTKQLTDVVAIRQLQKMGKDPSVWEFTQDYAMPRIINGKREKGKSPYAKFYRNTDNLSERMMVVSGLPMVDADGVKCEPQWIQAGNTYHQKNNVFSALVNDVPGRITLTCKNDQPDGIRKKNDQVVYSPQLFVSGVEIPRPPVVLLPVDPRNPNYLENTLEWDYGICKRHLRTVEGRIHGYWVFPANPGGEVRIVYNQTGQYRLKLGKYAIDADTEVIPASVFASTDYPFEVSDSATYNPNADPETTSMDSPVGRISVIETWANIRSGAGNSGDDSIAYYNQAISMSSAGTPDTWGNLFRSIFLFDSSGLPDAANISAAVLSVNGYGKNDGCSIAPDVAIYTSTPASNTALAFADYGQIGGTVQSDVITYASFISGGYNDFTLNATGRGNVSKTGISKFAARNANYDASGNAPTWPGGASFLSRLGLYFSEQGTGYKPKLVVTFDLGEPTVTTQAVTSITGITATGNGNITAIGGSAVTQHGHCWNTTGTPTTADSKTTKGNGLVGAFTSSITGLTPATLYYVRAYATNSGGTVYGDEVTFTALSTPTVTTQAVIDIVTTTATGRGNITNIGSSAVTQHGHCWNTTGTPTTADSKTTNGAGVAGAFTSDMTGLTEETKYYVKAYATNAAGTSYGAEVVFWAGLGTVYPIDPLIRVSRIRWVFDAFPGKIPDYYMEISLGGGSYVPAIANTKPTPAITPPVVTKGPPLRTGITEQDIASEERAPPVTEATAKELATRLVASFKRYSQIYKDIASEEPAPDIPPAVKPKIVTKGSVISPSRRTGITEEDF